MTRTGYAVVLACVGAAAAMSPRAAAGPASPPPVRAVCVTAGRAGQPPDATAPAPIRAPLRRDGAATVVHVAGRDFQVTPDGPGRVRVFRVASERWAAQDWSEGTGLPQFDVPPRPYAAAHLLLRRRDTGGSVAALGFGLRVPEMSVGELHNVDLDCTGRLANTAGVTVRRSEDAGPGWYVATIRLNPAAVHAASHNPDGREWAASDPPTFRAILARSWTAGRGVPHPEGPPSAVEVAAIALDEAAIELSVRGDAPGNVVCEPASPTIRAALRNRTERAISVRVVREVIPFERGRSIARSTVLVPAGASVGLDALAVAIRERGHYRVRIRAECEAGEVHEWRTNAAVLAAAPPPTAASVFGCWARLWGDEAPDATRAYLKERAGVGFEMGRHAADIRMERRVPDDASAEAFVRGLKPELRVLMLGWEHQWTPAQTFAFPGVLLNGRPEQLDAATAARADQVAEDWRRVARAARRLRPDIRLSLGNSAVNFSTPLLERGFRPGVEFDMLGTEEGMFDAPPERPADAIGNVSWWARAVCAHFGHTGVPLFHSEALYYATGPGFARLAERTQAAWYARAYLLGLPYGSIYGLCGAMIDSGNRYVYSQWGTSAYCNRAPDCSPKLSYVAFATMTRMVEGARYAGKVETGTSAVYALRFIRADGTPLCALWTTGGSRRAVVRIDRPDGATVFDALNRPCDAQPAGGSALHVRVSDLPTYVTGSTVTAVKCERSAPSRAPNARLVDALADLAAWPQTPGPVPALEESAEWRGVPRVRGTFRVSDAPALNPPGERTGSTVFRLVRPGPTHPLIPRYVSLDAPRAVPLPGDAGELAVWVRGACTWAEVKIVIASAAGQRWIVLNEDPSARMADSFDGWRLLRTGPLPDAARGPGRRIDRIVVTMPERQVYVDDLRPPTRPEIAISGLWTLRERPADATYQPW